MPAATHRACESLTVRLTRDAFDRIEALAYERRLLRSTLARELLMAALEAAERTAPVEIS